MDKREWLNVHVVSSAFQHMLTSMVLSYSYRDGQKNYNSILRWE